MPARESATGFVCGNCGGPLRLVGYGGDRRDRAVLACLRRGCEGRVQVPVPKGQGGDDRSQPVEAAAGCSRDEKAPGRPR